jgi:hypothetical protein
MLTLASISAQAQQPSGFKVYATGLEALRGLRFGPDGYLYVAEAGKGGTTSTVGKCEQVPGPVGPYTVATSRRVGNKDLEHPDRDEVRGRGSFGTYLAKS